MAKNLLIVESPAKAKTINKYLGKDFKVLASYGHVRDLVPKEGAVNTEDDFAMAYQLIEKNEKHVNAIIKEMKKAEALYLATDPDREGEAISWHVAELLRERGLLEGVDLYRVVFSEITPRAIQAAVEKPRRISEDMVNAQQARRALDYLVGFNLSPVLWRKVQAGLSAGRVQSPALRMIVEREEEIEAFVPQEYWKIRADLAHDIQGFEARLHTLDGERFEQFTITNEADATAAKARIEAAANGKLNVTKVEKKQRKRRPSAPFTTSTLQQEASRKLGFTARRTMRTAQKLYEGVTLSDGEAVGLITYMRTDSTHLAGEAVAELRQTIAKTYGDKAVPESPNVYKAKSKNAQEAHEAVRPTSSARTPEAMAKYLKDDELKLYTLIWKRAMASQMIHATLNTVSVDLSAGDHIFRASGTTVVDPGFLAVYEEGSDKKSDDDDDKDRKLPPLTEGDVLDLTAVINSQHFTEPPPRYSEASLVKTLEEYGIGRPSTYASIIGVLQSRDYVWMDGRRFRPSDVGRAVAKFLTGHFTQYVDYEFTANLEDDLDAISRGEKAWIPLLKNFWTPFKELVEDKMETVDRREATGARDLGIDPKSGKPISVRLGRYGPYAQIGTAEDEEKPTFASLRQGMSLHTITLEEALKLFELPRKLGEYEGEMVSAAIGRFGPYVKHGKVYASLKKEDDPYTIEYDRAVELIKEKIEIIANRIIHDFPDEGIQVLRGRWGPYVTDGNKNGRIPKDEDAETMTLDRFKEILAAAPEKKRRGAKKKAAKKASRKKASKKAAKKKSTKKATRKKAASKKAATKKTKAS